MVCENLVHSCFAHHFYRTTSRGAVEIGTLSKLGDLTTDEYSFVIKCTVSRHLPVRRKTLPPCRGGGPQDRRGFPCTRLTFLSFSNSFMLSGDASGGVHVGVRPPPPLRGSSPCEAGQFFPSGFDCRHSGPEQKLCTTQLSQFIFSLVLNPPECELFLEIQWELPYSLVIPNPYARFAGFQFRRS